MGFGSDGGAKQTWHPGGQIKTAIETIGKLGQITMRIFCVINRVVGSAQRRLQVAQYRVDPTELGALHGWSAAADPMAFVRGGGVRNGPETPQAIRNDMRRRGQAVGRPRLECCMGKARHGCQSA